MVSEYTSADSLPEQQSCDVFIGTETETLRIVGTTKVWRNSNKQNAITNWLITTKRNSFETIWDLQIKR